MSDLAEITGHLAAFWGDRTPPWHHPMLLHEFGDGALVAVEEDAQLVGYLFGILHTQGSHAYVHLIAVHADHRGRGIAGVLYDAFEDRARAHGRATVKAITTPANTISVAFHQARGMRPELVADYSGPNEPRVVLTKTL